MGSKHRVSKNSKTRDNNPRIKNLPAKPPEKVNSIKTLRTSNRLNKRSKECFSPIRVQCVNGDFKKLSERKDSPVFYMAGLYQKSEHDMLENTFTRFLSKEESKHIMSTMTITGQNGSSATEVNKKDTNIDLDVNVEKVVGPANKTADKVVHEEVAKPETFVLTNDHDWVSFDSYMESKYPKQIPVKATQAEFQEAVRKFNQWNMSPYNATN